MTGGAGSARPQQPGPEQARRADDEVAASRQEDADDGGDPVCWLHRVCPDCGRMSDREPPTTCADCGRQIPLA